MNIALEGLRRLAQSAIDCVAKNPLSQVVELIPVVQICSTRYIEFSPIKHHYLGLNAAGHHLYYLDARDILLIVAQAQKEQQKTRTRRVKLKVSKKGLRRRYKPALTR